MMLSRVLILLSALSCVLCNVGLAFIDSNREQYFNKHKLTQISPDGFVTTLTSLLSLSPRYYVGSRVSLEIEALLTGDVFTRPTANLLFRIAGVTQDNFTASLSTEMGRPFSLLTMTGETYQIPRADDFKLLAEPELPQAGSLDYTQLPENCGADCLEEALIELTSKIGATYVPADKLAFTGVLTFSKFPGLSLDLSMSTDRYFAGEIAALYVLTKQFQTSAVSGLKTAPQLIEGSFSSLKNVATEYGGQSQQVKASCVVLLDVLNVMLNMLEKSYQGGVSAQIVFLGESSLQEVEALYAVKRKLLAEPAASGNSTGNSTHTVEEQKFTTQWSAQALGIISFVVLVYFLGAGLYCMCCMKFTQDTLLYSRAKVD
eukprot:TRINITY_DN706_c0_g1_i1.p1 TRINITY_DN706_c0_g1~~TRINITY_DN706_c0_g1_i1.p1  ORF type:complete len:374 (-),score=52.06 TRINITY_DN706_c0_g1_i1:307-1428(-)